MSGTVWERFLPGAALLRRYRREWLRADLVAGVALFGLLVPAGMGYAEASGLPAVTGLYATIIPMLVYAVFGPSRVLVLGPDSALAPLIAVAVVPLAIGDSSRAVALAGLLSIITGTMLLAGRWLRLGFMTGLLSKPIRVGYLNGVALVVITGQLSKLLDTARPDGNILQDIALSVREIAEGRANPVAAIVGAACMAVLLLPAKLRFGLPGVLIAVTGAMLATAVLRLDLHVPVVGALPQGLPSPALGGLEWADVALLLPAAGGIALMSFADTGVLSATLASRGGRTVDGNQEMGALGAANIAAGLFGGFPVSASTSRTPVALQAGARSPVAGIAAALLVAAFMLAAPGVTAFLPSAALAAVVIVAASSMVDVKTLMRLVRMSRGETAQLLAAFLGVALVGVLEGIGIAVGLSLLAFVWRAWNPYRTELVQVADIPGFHDVDRHPDGRRTPGLVIARFDAPLFFANGAVFSTHIKELVAKATQPVRWVIVAAEGITGIDTTATEDLVELDKYLQQLDVELLFAELKGPVKDKLVRFGVGSRFDSGHFYPTLRSAYKEFREQFPR